MLHVSRSAWLLLHCGKWDFHFLFVQKFFKKISPWYLLYRRTCNLELRCLVSQSSEISPICLVLIFSFIPSWACVSIFKKWKERSVAPPPHRGLNAMSRPHPRLRG